MIIFSPVTSVTDLTPKPVKNIEKNTVTSIWSNLAESPDVTNIPLELAKKNINEVGDLFNIENDDPFAFLTFTLSDKQASELEKVRAHYEKYKARYEAVSKETGVPPELVCAIHYLEGHLDFNTYLHNGQKLGKKTTIEPKGVFFKEGQWHEAAVDALKRKKSYITEDFYTNIEAQLRFTESYNGFGYSNKRQKDPARYGDLYSPYVYAGTSLYKKGLYVRDGKFDPNYVFEGLGSAAILKALTEV